MARVTDRPDSAERWPICYHLFGAEGNEVETLAPRCETLIEIYKATRTSLTAMSNGTL